MDETLRQEEIEGAVDDRRRNSFAGIAAIQISQNIVGAHGLMAGKQDFEHLTPTRGQSQPACCAKVIGLRQQLTLAPTVVVFAKRNSWRLGFFRHIVIL